MTLTRSGRARPCSALTLLSLVVFSTLLTVVAAHDHHETEDVGPYEHNFTNDEPLDSVIQWHIGSVSLHPRRAEAPLLQPTQTSRVT